MCDTSPKSRLWPATGPRWLGNNAHNDYPRTIPATIPETVQGNALHRDRAGLGQEGHSFGFGVLAQGEAQGNGTFFFFFFYKVSLIILFFFLWDAVQQRPKWTSEKQKQRGEGPFPPSPFIQPALTECPPSARHSARPWGYTVNKQQPSFLPSPSLLSRGMTGITQSHK